ncbi:HNH endonuclease [Micromonospora sp. NPDC047187]|uniref:HNH endonuclease n=1 Tax=Micromonospora sp. NPDC047187 TaxID=3155262 RepID=UPI0033E8CFEC
MEHGTPGRYKYGCRCEPCKKAITRENNEWRLKNPDKFRANQERYRRRNPVARKNAHVNRVEAPFDDEALAYWEIIRHDPCVYCGEPADTVDHIDPVSRSRRSDWMNLAPACKPCNSSKGTKSLLDFLAYKELTV